MDELARLRSQAQQTARTFQAELNEATLEVQRYEQLLAAAQQRQRRLAGQLQDAQIRIEGLPSVVGEAA